MPRRARRSLVLFCLVWACDDELRYQNTASEDAQEDANHDAPDEVAPSPAGGCQTSDDCPNDGWCLHGLGCGVASECVEEIPCSAAPPFWACGCDGRLASFSAGCPEAHYGWQHNNTWAQPWEGEPCDPDAPSPRLDVQVVADSSQSPAHNRNSGALLWLAVTRQGDRYAQTELGRLGANVWNGTLTFELPQAISAALGPYDEVQHKFYVFADINYDGACTPFEDWTGGAGITSLALPPGSPARLDIPLTLATEETCAVW
jgi:hypothetical protein